MFVETILL